MISKVIIDLLAKILLLMQYKEKSKKIFFNFKGKFKQLLENEIKIPRTLNNENIIKIYYIKKSANSFYLILEYCNEDDLNV